MHETDNKQIFEKIGKNTGLRRFLIREILWISIRESGEYWQGCPV